MGYGKFGSKLLGTHALMTLVLFFLYTILGGIFADSQLYQWLISIFLIAVFWFVIYADASYYGQNDLKRGTFHTAKGFISGLIASIPGLILYILALVLPSLGWFEVALRFWLIPYFRFFIVFSNYMPGICIVLLMLFPLVSGVSYLDGIRRREKIMKAIEERESKRAELSKRNK